MESMCVWLVGVVVRRYIDFLILLIATPLLSVLFCSSIPTFCSFLNRYCYQSYGLHVLPYICKSHANQLISIQIKAI